MVMPEIRKPSKNWIVKENKSARLTTPLFELTLLYYEPGKWTVWNPMFMKDILEKEFDSFEEAAITAEDYAIRKMEECITMIKEQ